MSAHSEALGSWHHRQVFRVIIAWFTVLGLRRHVQIDHTEDAKEHEIEEKNDIYHICGSFPYDRFLDADDALELRDPVHRLI